MSKNPPTGDTSPPTQQDDDTKIRQDYENRKMATFNVPYHMRNAEEVHNAMLQEAKEYHDNLRKQAELVLAKHLLDESLAVVKWEHEQREDIIRLQTEITLEKKKIQDMGLSALEAEAELKESERKTAAARIKLQVLTDDVDALKKKITTPPPASTPAPAAASVNPPAATLNPVPTPATQQRHPAALPTIQVIDQPGEASQELSDPMTPPAKPPAKPTLLRPNVRPAAPSGPSAADTQATSTPQPAPPTQPAPSTQQAPSAQPAPPAPTTAKYTFEGARSFLSGMVDEPNTQKYVSIHMNSKRLRNQVKPKGKENTTPLKDIAMKQSSAIRIAMGQLSGVGKNSAIVSFPHLLLCSQLTFIAVHQASRHHDPRFYFQSRCWQRVSSLDDGSCWICRPSSGAFNRPECQEQWRSTPCSVHLPPLCILQGIGRSSCSRSCSKARECGTNCPCGSSYLLAP